jgi:hypothetical protein
VLIMYACRSLLADPLTSACLCLCPTSSQISPTSPARIQADMQTNRHTNMHCIPACARARAPRPAPRLPLPHPPQSLTCSLTDRQAGRQAGKGKQATLTLKAGRQTSARHADARLLIRLCACGWWSDRPPAKVVTHYLVPIFRIFSGRLMRDERW